MPLARIQIFLDCEGLAPTRTGSWAFQGDGASVNMSRIAGGGPEARAAAALALPSGRPLCPKGHMRLLRGRGGPGPAVPRGHDPHHLLRAPLQHRLLHGRPPSGPPPASFSQQQIGRRRGCRGLRHPHQALQDGGGGRDASAKCPHAAGRQAPSMAGHAARNPADPQVVVPLPWAR